LLTKTRLLQHRPEPIRLTHEQIQNKETAAIAMSWFFHMKRVGIKDPSRLFDRSKKFDAKFYTDGVGVSFQFTRPRRTPAEDLKPNKIKKLDTDEFRFVDPGRINVFTAVDSISTDPENPCVLRQFSAVEYYHVGGLKKIQRSQVLAKAQHQADHDREGTPELGIIKLEESIPTKKTMDLNQFGVLVRRMGEIYESLTLFYNERWIYWRLKAYSGKQRAYQEMVKALTWGSSKYTRELARKPPTRNLEKYRAATPDPERERNPPEGRLIVVVGDARFPASGRGRPAAPQKLTKKLRILSRQLGRGKLIVLEVNEYLTSKVIFELILDTFLLL
jgi:hypothetical protein